MLSVVFLRRMVSRGLTAGVLVKYSCLLYPQKNPKTSGISEGYPVVTISCLPSLPSLGSPSLGPYGSAWI